MKEEVPVRQDPCCQWHLAACLRLACLGLCASSTCLETGLAGQSTAGQEEDERSQSVLRDVCPIATTMPHRVEGL